MFFLICIWLKSYSEFFLLCAGPLLDQRSFVYGLLPTTEQVSLLCRRVYFDEGQVTVVAVVKDQDSDVLLLLNVKIQP
jgi:hypothetical protein